MSNKLLPYHTPLKLYVIGIGWGCGWGLEWKWLQEREWECKE